MQVDCEAQTEEVALEECEIPPEPFGSLLDRVFPTLACLMLVVVVVLLVHTVMNGG